VLSQVQVAIAGRAGQSARPPTIEESRRSGA